MAKIGETVFRKYVDGQDRITAQEYMREREILRLALNDAEDKYEIVNDMQREFSDINSEISQNRQATESTLAQVIGKAEEIKIDIEQGTALITNVARQSVEVIEESTEEARTLANDVRGDARRLLAEIGMHTGNLDEGDWDEDDNYVSIDGGTW